MKYKGPIESKIPQPVLNPIQYAKHGRSFFLFEARMSAKETVYGGAAALAKVEEACRSIKVEPLPNLEIKDLTKHQSEGYVKITRWTNSRK